MIGLCCPIKSDDLDDTALVGTSNVDDQVDGARVLGQLGVTEAHDNFNSLVS
jgi:hypothetical protein